MPAKEHTNGMASAQSTSTLKRFELPALDLKFGSLTDGTDIPPPLPSPKEEMPPPQPKAAPKKGEKAEDQQPKAEAANGATNGPTADQGASRPPSRTASVMAEEKKSKRSSGWFRRLRSHDTSHDTKPAALQFENAAKKATAAGPPPPMIPELSALETKIDTRLGDDLFKGIGRDS
ncbi:hypothetical protein SAMD00023353_4200260 [Rosellinia necatrix]|uniref:Uncharacterized protein n=1 Tax=Rosellinia necatrix TaxID=77044 RepID=A0A1W2TP64_ROSNE|nr:hypothetical protein SAMD00023353_4200260 [Rosellinia necatrix]